MTTSHTMQLDDDDMNTARKALTAWANECMREAENACAGNQDRAARYWQAELQTATDLLERIRGKLNA